MDWYIILLIILASICFIYIIISLIVSIYIVNYLTKPYTYPLNESIERAIKYKRMDLKLYDQYNKEELFIRSQYNYNLKATLIHPSEDITFSDNKNRYVILLHGWTSNRFNMLLLASMYLKLGFNVLIYDHRNHLQSDRKITTMGDKEADDLQTIINFLKEKDNDNIIIGTHGESMGATTAMIHAGRYHSVDFVVEDCGYNSLKDLLKYNIKYLKKIPVFPILQFTNFIFYLKTKTRFNDVDVSQYLSTCDDIPMCFIHGDSDRFVPTYMVYKCYDLKNGDKQVLLYKNSKHIASITDHSDKYYQDIKSFLYKSNIIDN